MPREEGSYMNVTPSLTLSEETVEVDGLEIYYRMGGSGPPLLLLHGGTCIGRDWDQRHLDAFAEHFTVIVPDLPGHGSSPTLPREGWYYPAFGRIMFALLDELGVGRARGIGYSAGGVTLLHMAAANPSRLEAMVLVGAGHHFVPEARNKVAGWHLETLDQDFAEYLLASHPGGEAQVRTLLTRLRDTDVSCTDLAVERLKEIPARTLLVTGDRDLTFPLKVVLEAYATLPNAALWVIPEANHWTIWQSEEFQAAFPTTVHKFLEGSLGG